MNLKGAVVQEQDARANSFNKLEVPLLRSVRSSNQLVGDSVHRARNNDHLGARVEMRLDHTRRALEAGGRADRASAKLQHLEEALLA